MIGLEIYLESLSTGLAERSQRWSKKILLWNIDKVVLENKEEADPNKVLLDCEESDSAGHPIDTANVTGKSDMFLGFDISNLI